MFLITEGWQESAKLPKKGKETIFYVNKGKIPTGDMALKK